MPLVTFVNFNVSVGIFVLVVIQSEDQPLGKVGVSKRNQFQIDWLGKREGEGLGRKTMYVSQKRLCVGVCGSAYVKSDR